MYVKWPQDQYIKDNVSEIERKEKIRESLLHPSYKHFPYLLYYMSMTTLISKLLPFFVTSDKGVSTSSVKVSIHAHKLCHDDLKCHSTH